MVITVTSSLIAHYNNYNFLNGPFLNIDRNSQE
jgi:hypothetical protein